MALDASLPLPSDAVTLPLEAAIAWTVAAYYRPGAGPSVQHVMIGHLRGLLEIREKTLGLSLVPEK